MLALMLHPRDRLHVAFPRSRGDRGASSVEYALILAFIFLVLIISVVVIGDTTSEGLDDAGSSGFVEGP
jgi:Flp pilus assembly pilin Flp